MKVWENELDVAIGFDYPMKNNGNSWFYNEFYQFIIIFPFTLVSFSSTVNVELLGEEAKGR